MRHTKLIERLLDVRMYSGDEAYCLCPFHDDSNPSFAINRKSGLWICHGCGLKGNLKGLTELLGKDAPVATVDELLERIDELRNPAPLIPEPDYPPTWLLQFDAPSSYWDDRGFTSEAIKTWQLGFDPITQYATIPLRKHNGQLVGVVRRATRPDQKPKYVYPKGFQAAGDMFASWAIKSHHAVLVEGALDAIAVWEAGYNGLAIYGSIISPQQIELLSRLGVSTVTILTDNDPAGKRASAQIVESLTGMIIRLPEWESTDAKDPGEMDRFELSDLINHARHIWEIDDPN